MVLNDPSSNRDLRGDLRSTCHLLILRKRIADASDIRKHNPFCLLCNWRLIPLYVARRLGSAPYSRFDGRSGLNKAWGVSSESPRFLDDRSATASSAVSLCVGWSFIGGALGTNVGRAPSPVVTETGNGERKGNWRNICLSGCKAPALYQEAYKGCVEEHAPSSHVRGVLDIPSPRPVSG